MTGRGGAYCADVDGEGGTREEVTGNWGDGLSLDHRHTLAAVFYLRHAKQGKGWTERRGSSRFVSFLLDLGKLPKLELGVLEL